MAGLSRLGAEGEEIMTRAFLLVLCLMLFGCDDGENKTAQYALNNLVYVRDVRTGLCFAFYWGGSAHGGPGFTTVPCEAVLDYLPKYPACERPSREESNEV